MKKNKATVHSPAVTLPLTWAGPLLFGCSVVLLTGCSALLFSGCSALGVGSSFRDILIRSYSEANDGNVIFINIVVPATPYSKEEIDEFKENVEGWFQLSPEEKDKHADFVVDARLDPRKLIEKSRFVVPPAGDEHLIAEGGAWRIATPDEHEAKALAHGLYIWVRYRFDENGDPLDDEGKADYSGPTYIEPERLTGSEPIVIMLQANGVKLEY